MTTVPNSPLATDRHDPFAGPAIHLTAPATDSQREIWAAVQMGADASCAFNETNSIRFSGGLDVEAMRAAFNDLVARHEALRTTFNRDGTSLVVTDSVSIGPPILELAECTEEERASAVAGLLAMEAETPFDLELGPLVRATLLHLGQDSYELVFTAHHIICDGWSTGVLIRDLAALYNLQRTGAGTPLAQPFPFSSYALECIEAETSLEFAEARAWWLAKYAGSIPNLELPADAVRPPSKTYNSARVDHVLDRDLVDQLRHFGVQSKASLFTVVLAGFTALLHRLTGETDLAVGVLSAGQASSGHLDMVGHAVNTLPIRCSVDGSEGFRQLVARLRSEVFDAVERSSFSFGSLLRQLPLARDPSRLPLVSVLFNLESEIALTEPGFAELEARFTNLPRRFENFDLFLNAVDCGEGLRLECQYNTDLFDEATVRRWLGSLGLFLHEGTADLAVEIDRLPILTDDERASFRTWNETGEEYARERMVHELVQDQVERSPDSVGLIFEDKQLTYRELDRRSNSLARRLRALGVTRSINVGLCIERSIEMVVGMLAISKAGGAYVPLDPAYPRDRIELMVRDAHLSLIVTQETCRNLLSDINANLLSLDGEGGILDEADAAPLPRALGASSEDVLYTIYTSGSTGLPKGVLVPHRSVMNLLSTATVTPGMRSTDVIVAVTTLSFDIAVMELWLPLTVGATVVIASREATGDGQELLKLIHQHRATVMQATPSTWRLLIHAGWDGRAQLKAICGGEPLPADLAFELSRRSPEVWNMYGPTETTVWSSCYHLPVAPVLPIPIGKPMGNTQFHILDGYRNPCPIGVAGELYIGGDGVTLGYHERPELTAERFLPDPFESRPGALIYRTGDLARWRPTGNVEFLGRIDNQVKVRGFRIELGEIEAALTAVPSVAEAAVVAREDTDGDVRLTAYLVSRAGQDWSAAELRDEIRRRLPDYMLPQRFVALESMPLTPNGKIDRKALPEPAALVGSIDRYSPPTSAAEELLVAIWQDVLKVGRVGIHDDFFQLGGHSLLAAQVCSRLAQQNVTLPIRQVFESSTIARLAPFLGPAGADRIPAAASGSPAPGSVMQRRFWLLEQFGSSAGTLNLPAAWRLSGELDHELLVGAIRAFVRRHDATRTTLHSQGQALAQVVADDLQLDLGPIDIDGDSDAERQDNLMLRLLEEAQVPFDLAAGPLFRASLFRLGPRDHVLFFVIHHAIWDGWSFDILLRELDEDYRAAAAGSQPLPRPPIQYADFASWQRDWLNAPGAAEQARYWDRELATLTPDLELPTDRPRTLPPPHAGATSWIDVPRDETERLVKLGLEEGATTFMVLAAAYALLLHRYSGQSEFLVGTPLRGRSQSDTEEVVGVFINDVVLRMRIDPKEGFRELLRRVRRTVLEALSHPDLPFEAMKRAPATSYRAFFSFQDARNRFERLGELALGQVHILTPAAPTDVALWIMQKESGLVGGLNYSTELFDDGSMRQLLANFRFLLGAIVENPIQPIGKLVFAMPENDWAVATGQKAGPPGVLHHRFDLLADEQPDAPAVVEVGAIVTYRGLDLMARSAAVRMANAGIGRGSLVGILLTSPTERLSALLALSRIGAVPIPLDPRHPAARIERILGDSRAQAVLVDAGRETDDAGWTALRLGGERTQPLASVEDSQAPIPNDIALIAYTSGPHGPLGVRLTHATLWAAVDAVREATGIGPSDVLLGTSDTASGRAVLEAWLALSSGAALVAATPATLGDGPSILSLLRSSNATAMHAEPAVWRQVVEAGWNGGAGFTAISSGEAVSGWLASELLARAGRAFSIYGLAESGYWSGLLPLTELTGSGQVGIPIGGSRWYIVDRDLQAVPPGVPGELLIGGSIAEGTTDPEESTHRFLLEPIAATSGDLVLRTGDRVRLRADGCVEFLSRQSDRLSIRGLRVEPAEVEVALERHPAVGAAAITADDGLGDRMLTAHFVCRPGGDYTESELRKHLRDTLPNHMVPRRFIEVTELPRTADGRVDRPALAQALRPRRRERIEPRSEAEKLLADIWEKALGVTGVGVEDNFFELGGHSLLCLQALAQIEERTGRTLSPRLFLLDTLEQVALKLDDAPVQKHSEFGERV